MHSIQDFAYAGRLPPEGSQPIKNKRTSIFTEENNTEKKIYQKYSISLRVKIYVRHANSSMPPDRPSRLQI